MGTSKINIRNLERLIAIVSSIPLQKFDLYTNKPDISKKKPTNDYEPKNVYIVGKDERSPDRLYYWDKNTWNNLFNNDPMVSIKTIEQQADVFEFIFGGVDDADNPFNSPEAVVNRMEEILNFAVEFDDLPDSKELEMIKSKHNIFVFQMEIIPFDNPTEIKPEPIANFSNEISKLEQLKTNIEEEFIKNHRLHPDDPTKLLTLQEFDVVSMEKDIAAISERIHKMEKIGINMDDDRSILRGLQTKLKSLRGDVIDYTRDDIIMVTKEIERRTLTISLIHDDDIREKELSKIKELKAKLKEMLAYESEKISEILQQA